MGEWLRTIGQCLLIFSITIYFRILEETEDREKLEDRLGKFKRRLGPVVLVGVSLHVINAILKFGWLRGLLQIPMWLVVLQVIFWVSRKLVERLKKADQQ